MFAPGQVVRVRDEWPEARGPAHVRTPDGGEYDRGERAEGCCLPVGQAALRFP